MCACGPIQLLSMKALPAKIAFKAGQEVIMIFYTKIDFFFLYKDSSLPFKIFVEGMEGNTIMATFPPLQFSELSSQKRRGATIYLQARKKEKTKFKQNQLEIRRSSLAPSFPRLRRKEEEKGPPRAPIKDDCNHYSTSHSSSQ